jgi:hypothetical protein
MAMTKSERTALAHAQLRAERHRALRWSDAREIDLLPDVPPPEYIGYTDGWYCNGPAGKVDRRWSTSSGHGFGPYADYVHSRRSASQGSIALYSTRARALRALRRFVEEDAAQKLAKIDDEINQPEPT